MLDTMHTATARIRVLVVEDEARLRELIVRELTEMNAVGVGAGDAEQALAIMQNQTADVILLDLNLPRIDGMTFLDTLRAQWPDTPVIILTAFGTLESAQRAIRHNVVDYLRKPCHLGEIETALARARERIAQCTNLTSRTSAEHDSFGGQPAGIAESTAPPERLDALEKQAILAALQRCDGNRTAAARALGISRRTLYNKLNEYGEGSNTPTY